MTPSGLTSATPPNAMRRRHPRRSPVRFPRRHRRCSDAVTVAPYMGHDSVGPFIQAAKEYNKGVFVLVRTSNPGAAEIQDMLTPRWHARLSARRQACGEHGARNSSAAWAATPPWERWSVPPIPSNSQPCARTLPANPLPRPRLRGSTKATAADVAKAFKSDGHRRKGSSIPRAESSTPTAKTPNMRA